MSPDSSVSSPVAPAIPPVAPLSHGTAFAVLGSMVLLIVGLTILLVQTTRVDPARAEAPVTADGGRLAQR